MKQTDITGFIEESGFPVSQAQVELLLDYEACLVGRGASLGLISKQDRERVRERHVLDCVRAAVAAPPLGLAYDLGSGGGLPGVVVAILQPELSVRLVERRGLRIAFLEWVVDQLALRNVEVVGGRIEDLPGGAADVCFARALASISQSWGLASALLKLGGRLIYFAGKKNDVPRSLPGARSIFIQPGKVLETSGPLAIITR